MSDPTAMLTNVLQVLQQSDSSLEQNSYSYSTQNSLPPSWLIQSSPDDTACQLLETIQEQFKALVQNEPNKTHFIDITQMGNNNITDLFQAAMIASIIDIAEVANQKVVIRYLEGNGVGFSEPHDMTFIQHLKSLYGDQPLAQVYFYAVSFVIPWEGLPVSNLPGSWTHAKLFSIDGITTIAGGQNFWNDYIPRLGHIPPHDVSMRINGAASTAAHQFANTLWNYVAGQVSSGNLYIKSWRLGAPTFGTDLPPTFDAGVYPPPIQPEAIPILAVGNLGMWLPGELDTLKNEAVSVLTNPKKQVSPKNTYEIVMNAYNGLLDFPFSTYAANSSKATQASTTARHLLLKEVAQNGHLRISQQKIADTDMVGTPVYNGKGGVPWPGQFMDAIVSALKDKNATVDIIVSFRDSGSYSPIGGYSDDMGAVALRGVIVDLLGRALNNTEQANILANKLLTVKTTDITDQPSNNANHAKIWIVDDKVFYVGSDNIYPAYLQEFGYVIGSIEKTQEFIQNYWIPMWELSKTPGV